MQMSHTLRATHPHARNRVRAGAALLCLSFVVASAAASSEGPHADLDRFLQRSVDVNGTIDYASAQRSTADLDRYIRWLMETSPDSHPRLFPSSSDQLAYWINAYNAWVIRKVLDHYPIASVKDVHPSWLFFVPKVAGFFVFETITLGGKETNLRALENEIIRERFADPRVHFALNCASRGCPKLPNRAFTAAGLDAELARETKRFLTDPARVRIDTHARRLFVSSIFKWYRSDFEDWMKREQPGKPASIQGYLATQLPGLAADGADSCMDCAVEFVEYDWGLNDRKAG